MNEESKLKTNKKKKTTTKKNYTLKSQFPVCRMQYMQEPKYARMHTLPRLYSGTKAKQNAKCFVQHRSVAIGFLMFFLCYNILKCKGSSFNFNKTFEKIKKTQN